MQKDAFLKKQIQKQVGGALQKGISKYFLGNTASGAAEAGVGNAVKSTLRSVAGIRPGQAAFKKPLDYVTRPLRAMAVPNLGTPLNVARGGLIAGAVAHQGYKGYDALGDAANAADRATNLASAMGASNQMLGEMNRYGTRKGVLAAWLRGHRGLAWLGGGNAGLSSRQKTMDRLVAGSADELAFEGMANAMNSGVKFRELLNPVGALATRKTMQTVGKKNLTEGLEGGLGSSLKSLRAQAEDAWAATGPSRTKALNKVIDTGSDLSRGLKNFWRENGGTAS